ncbi:MAG: RDD family protein [Candidatus Doudnabacteria bacterium]|nr:RDD family protein [Candidatus Doudnabacteria bacterium]
MPPVPSAPTSAVVYATFWERFAASFIDGIIILAVTFGVSFLLGVALTKSSGPSPVGNFLGLMVLVGEWLYFALMESSGRQGTIGKGVMGIKVTDLDHNRVSFGRASGRFFGRMISSLILGIGYLFMLFTEKRQNLHDIMAGTLIVKK